MIRVSEIAEHWFGLCRKAPTFRTAPVLITTPMETMLADRPDSSGPGRIRQGVSIATGSLKAVIRDRHLLRFSLLPALLMTFLFALIYWTKGHVYYDPFVIRISLGDFILWFDPRLVPILAFCLFGFTLLMAGLILYRNADRSLYPLTIREGFAGARSHAGPLASLSIALALAGTILIAVVSSDNLDFFATISFPVMDTFLPYHWFLPSSLEVTITILFFGTILFLNTIMFLALLYVVPVIALENKGLVFALAGSVTLIRKTWREMLGCLLVYGTIVLMVGILTQVISQSLSIFNYDPNFFYSQGLMPVATVGSEFILFCSAILMAAGVTAAGIAIADLYHIGKSSGILEETLKKPEHAL